MRPGRLTITAPPTFRCHAAQEVSINTRRRVDPTNTAMVRRAFEAEVRRRFARIIKAVEAELARIIGGQPMPAVLLTHDAGERYVFERTADKTAAFLRWLRRLADAEVLGVFEGAEVARSGSQAWSNLYIDTAYQRGIRQAGANLRRAGARVEPSWVTSAFNRPVHADRVAMVYSRVFNGMRDVTQVMARQMGEVLALGMAEGRNPLDIARDLRDRVQKVGITRARLIARTEVIAAHADATLNAYEEAGIEGVQVESEWSTAGDDRVCPLCEENEGKTYNLAQARGLIPLHPNCRCAWLPSIVGGSGIRLNWSHSFAPTGRGIRMATHAARAIQDQRHGRYPPAAVRGPHAHHRAGGHRGGGRAQRRAASRGGAG
jgi:SPP1 gp7 family putative phage head morphogenesis protein